MRSPTSEHRRAILVTLVSATVIVGAVGGVARALSGQADPILAVSASTYSPPLHLAHYDATTVDATAAQLRLVVDDDQRNHHALVLAVHHSIPFLAAAATGRHDLPTFVLVAREKPYRFDTLVPRYPQAFTTTSTGAVLVHYPVLIAPGATLIIDASATPTVLLRSDTSGYASVTALSSTLDLRGTPARPLRVSSYDLSTSGPDLTVTDGRAYLQTRGGTLTLRATKADHLGFAIGRSSGVAWLGQGTTPASGGAAWSTFQNNHFGAYAFAARGLVITHSAFLDNDIYGFDPHDGTNDSVVSDSVAARNGRHGFIFSRGCRHNTLRNDEAYDNGVAGFVIDDGHVAQDGNPRHAVAVPSDGNALIHISAHDNGIVGVSIEGGTENSLEASQVENNKYGVWVKNAATGTRLTTLSVTRSQASAIVLFDGTQATHLSDVRISGATVGVVVDHAVATVMSNVDVSDATTSGLRLRGPHTEDVVSQVSISGTGRRAVDAGDVAIPDTLRSGIDDSGWETRHPPVSVAHYLARHANLLAWVPIIVLPLLFWIPARRRRSPGTPLTPAQALQ